MESRTDSLVILAGYPGQMENLLLNGNEGLAGRFNGEDSFIRMADYPPEALYRIFRKNLGNADTTGQFDNNIRQVITSMYLRRDGSWRNAATMEVLAGAVLAQHRRTRAVGPVDIEDIPERYMKSILREVPIDEILADINKLTGLPEVKAKLRQLVITTIENRRLNEEEGLIDTEKPNLYFTFTGNPGTGKTTTVRGMLRIFEAIGVNVVLAAPTGRAAKRLSELCGMEAKTIHRLLEAGYQGGMGRLAFQRCRTNPLECDAVVLDEVSMVDIQLMQALVEALPHGARLVLVGDADQLPPVGPGNFLRDAIGSGRVPTIQLTEIFRQARESDIVMNAHAINTGQMPAASGRDGDFFIMRKSNPADIIETVAGLCSTRLPRHYGFSPSQIQVLTPSRRQGAGTVQLNRTLQEVLNPPGEGKEEKRFGDTVFRSGDRVMQVRNNYDIVWERMDGSEDGCGMFNGDVGEIVQIFPSQECLTVRFDDKLATYTFDMLGELELAYAMTVHKAQGSEFDAVVVALSPGTNPRLLTRNILYTAITRAKKLLVIVGSSEILHSMVVNNTRGRRYSALKLRLKGVTAEPLL